MAISGSYSVKVRPFKGTNRKLAKSSQKSTKSLANKDSEFDVPAKVRTFKPTKRSTTKDLHRFIKLSAKEDATDPDFDVPVKARPLKRKKQTTTKDLQGFADGKDFEVERPFLNSDEEDDVHNGFHGPFRWNIRRYLVSWSTVLEFGHAQTTMHIVEEDVRISRSVYCENCRVADVSKKYGMEYRLLHAVTTGHPWYGEWGYQFGGGSFALTSEAYHNSVDDLSNIPLSLFFSHARSPRSPLHNTIALYWSLSDRQILTVRDLFCFIMQLLHDARGDQIAGDTIPKIPSEASRGVMCPWTMANVAQAEQALIKVLRAANGSQWVTWRALRGATCRAVESPELLDCCLKTLEGRITHDGMVVAVRCNPETNCVEYRLEADSEESEQMCNAQCLCRPTRDHLLRDLRFLYDALLNPATMQKYKPEARWESAVNSAVKILDCKQLVKRYDDAAPSLSKLRIWCNIQLVDQQEENIVPPPELLILPINATVASLKQEATKAFQETYLIFQRFEAERLIDFENVSHSTPVALLLGLNGNINVSGRCLGVNRKLEHFRMERGMETWIVDCICGARDDDGERMLACDSCGVWQHTRCNSIGDVEEAPETFVCMKCMIFKRSNPCSGGGGHDGYRRYKESISHEFVCKGKIIPSLTKTHITFDDKRNKDEIAAHERNCMHEIATKELICNDKTPFIMETDTAFPERSRMDKIHVKEFIFEDEITLSLMEADTMFLETNCKDKIDVPFHEAEGFMCMISVM